MSKLGWGSAAIYSRPSSSLHTHTPRAAVVRQKLLDPIVRIDFEGFRWFAVCTAPACERRVARELIALGFKTYCPLGQKYVFFQQGKRTKQRIIKQFPLLSRYIFVGAPQGMYVSKHANDRIVSVLGDSGGPLPIRWEALAAINNCELGGEWDDARFRPELSFTTGARVKLIGGPFQGLQATVDAHESETRLRVLVRMFDSVCPVVIDPCYAEAV